MEGDAGDGKNKNVWHELIKGRCIIGSKQKSRRFHHCCDNSALITCHHFPLLPQLCTYDLPPFSTAATTLHLPLATILQSETGETILV